MLNAPALSAKKTGNETEIQRCSRCKHLYCGPWLLFSLQSTPSSFVQAGPVRLLTGSPTNLCVGARVRVLCGMTNIADVKMEALLKEIWNLSSDHPNLKERAGDIVALRNRTIFVKTSRSSIVVMRLRCLSTGLKGSDGLAAGQMLG